MNRTIAIEGKAGGKRTIGIVLSALVSIFLLIDAGMKLASLPVSIQATIALGFREADVFTLGALGLLCTVLYMIPRTAVIGAVMLTGLLGGAVAAQMRVGAPLFSHVLFGVYAGIFAWLGLYLRDPRVAEIAFARR